MNPFDPARKALGEGPSDARRALQRARLSNRAPRQARPWVRPALVLAAAGLALAVWQGTRTHALVSDERGAIEPGAALVAQAPRVLQFSEGSRVTLSAATRAHLGAIDSSHVELSLDEGHLEATVTKHTGRTWRYHAGEWTVRVLGTSLSIDWRPSSGTVQVAVSEGSVEVSGAEGHFIIGAGESFQRSRPTAGPPAPPDPALVPSPAREPVPEPVVDAGSGLTFAPGPAPRPRPVRQSAALVVAESPDAGVRLGWRELLRSGHRADALGSANADGLLAAPEHLADADALELADAARIERQLSVARRLLQQVLLRAGPDAAEAAFLLGRLESDAQHPEAARAYFARSVALDGRGPFVEQARGRLLETLLELEYRRDAAEAARDYLEHYPRGAWADLAKKVRAEVEP